MSDKKQPSTTVVRSVEVFVLERMVDGVEDSGTQTNKRVSVVLTVDHDAQTVSVTPSVLMMVPGDRRYDRFIEHPIVFELRDGGHDKQKEWEELGLLIAHASEEGAERLREQRMVREGGKPNKELY